MRANTTESSPLDQSGFHSSTLYRDTSSTGKKIGDLLSHPDLFSSIILTSYFSMIILPGLWVWSILLNIVYSVWFFSRKYRLPFRLPYGWKHKDYSNRHSGSKNRYKSGTGLLYLGNHNNTNEELWISNDDAHRHALILGTTGSGKALTNDTLILTELGWVKNESIRTGDRIYHPSGAITRVRNVYPQGRQPIVQVKFADGRFIECSRDHLWTVTITSCDLITDYQTHVQVKTMTAADMGLAVEMSRLHGLGNSAMRLFVNLVKPIPGGNDLDRSCNTRAEYCGNQGLENKDSLIPLSGLPSQRLEWINILLSTRAATHFISQSDGYIDIPTLSKTDGYMLRQLIWSLGGFALEFETNGKSYIRASYPGQEQAEYCQNQMNSKLCEYGLEIVNVDGYLIPVKPGTQDKKCPESCMKPMSCIEVDAADGLFVIENFIVTHNTEMLLGLTSQALMWASGFLFIDGKGTSEFHARAWSLAKRFGREDDYRILNFTDTSNRGGRPAGSQSVQSNTLNPFSHGTPDQLMNLIVSLMGDVSTGSDMWKNRAMALVASAMKALCEMRDAGDVMLDVQSIRDFLPLGIGIKHELLEGKEITSINEIPNVAWNELRSRGGMIELYLRSLNDEFSEKSKLGLKGFFDTLPGFSLHDALNGMPQEGKAAEQHAFLSMQLTKPLGSLADDYSHIFCTPFGEVDFDDVVLNRRILVVLLPALQKAPQEMQNCGRIIVALLKMMMGRTSGYEIEGSKKMLVDARSTKSLTPFIAVLDEAGYYMVKGIDTMMAQARSLGFMMIISGQDMAAMQASSPQIAETVAANARLTVAGATEDANRTWRFFQSKFSKHKVPISSGRKSVDTLFGVKWVDRQDVTFVEEDRVKIGDLQALKAGEFYYLMGSILVRANAFYTGEYWAEDISLNKFLLIRGPRDRAPGFDQTKAERFIEAHRSICCRLLDWKTFNSGLQDYPFDAHDILYCAANLAEDFIKRNEGDDPDMLLANIRGLYRGAENVLNQSSRSWD